MTDLKQFFISHLSSLQGQMNNEHDLLASWGEGWQKLNLDQKKLVSEIFHRPICLVIKLEDIEQMIDRVKIKPEPTLLINRKTDAVWTLAFRNEKLTIDVPNYSFQIHSFTPTQFKPDNPEIKLEIEFEKDYQSQNLLMHLYAKGVKRASFEAL
jgi:hypothetical protein